MFYRILFSLTLLVFTLAPCYSEPLKKLENQLSWMAKHYQNEAKFSIAVEHVQRGETVRIRADKAKPLASVFKLPLLVALFDEMEQQPGLTLDTQLAIRESDLCIGSGKLQYRDLPASVSVREALELMITVSDNTATDLLAKKLTFERLQKWLKQKGYQSSWIWLTNRQAWLLSLRQCSSLPQSSIEQMLKAWNQGTLKQKIAWSKEVEKSTSKLTLTEFQRLEDRSANNQSYQQNLEIAASMDNLMSAKELAHLLAQLYKGKLLSPKGTFQSLAILKRQKYKTRLPRRLPKGVIVYHKTGTLAGIRNDVGLIEISPNNVVAVALLTQDVKEGSEAKVDRILAEMSRQIYLHYR